MDCQDSKEYLHTLRVLNQANTPIIQASKWLTVQVLLDTDEFFGLIQDLRPLFFFNISAVHRSERGGIPINALLETYRQYVEDLKKGKIPEERLYRSTFTSIATKNLDSIFLCAVGEEKFIVKADKPVIYLQPHYFDYSRVDGKFRSMVPSQKKISFGLQFSYPQLFLDPYTKIIHNVIQEDFANTLVFKKLQKWVRYNTVPTPFSIEGKDLNIPFRIGLKCFKWINKHPQFAENQLFVRKFQKKNTRKSNE